MRQCHFDLSFLSEFQTVPIFSPCPWHGISSHTALHESTVATCQCPCPWHRWHIKSQTVLHGFTIATCLYCNITKYVEHTFVIGIKCGKYLNNWQVLKVCWWIPARRDSRLTALQVCFVEIFWSLLKPWCGLGEAGTALFCVRKRQFFCKMFTFDFSVNPI